MHCIFHSILQLVNRLFVLVVTTLRDRCDRIMVIVSRFRDACDRIVVQVVTAFWCKLRALGIDPKQYLLIPKNLCCHRQN